MAKDVWRTVGGVTVRCTECPNNQKQEDGNDICTAEDEVCMFMNSRLDSQKTWDNFHDAYHEMAQVKDEHTEAAE